MKKLFIMVLILVIPLFGQITKDYTKYVNVFIGTGSVDSLSLSGSNFPGACVPLGLVQLSPDTDDNPEDPCSGYDYADSSIVGFSHTHLNGTGVADLFDFLFMPYTGKIEWESGSDDLKVKGYRSKFNHENESGYPGYYSVKLDDSNIKVELSATEHCGIHRYKYNGDDKNKRLIIDLDHSLDKARPYWQCRIINSQIKILSNKVIEGYREITGWASIRKVFFRAEFSKPFSNYKVKKGNSVYSNVKVVNGRKLKLNLLFDNPDEVIIKVGISSVSYEGARKNLASEIKDFDFENIVASAKEKWNKVLSKIEIDSDKRNKTIFYTGLYHLYIQPNNIADVDGAYYDSNGVLRKANDGKHYSTFSLWDTFRAAHPLYTILSPKLAANFINSMLRQYKYYGYLPIWQLWGRETYCMIGNHAIPVIADAIKKGIKGFDYGLAYEAIKNSSKNSHNNSNFELLDRFKYFPEDLQTQSVSIQLEMAFNDWCVAEIAKLNNYKEDYEYFSRRSTYYKNLFDKNRGFFRPKNKKGEWIEPFNPLKYGGNGGYAFTEGNAWQYLWFVPHDIEGFVKLLGGRSEFKRKLDEFFTLEAKPEDVNGNASGFIGQYAHGNEPSHHISYLYNFTDEPNKTAYYVNRICNELYNDTESGYSGNEDCGQMSAWFIFSALGFYPVNPADNKYYFGSPQINNAIIRLENGKIFKVLVKNKSGKEYLIKKTFLNGKELKRNFIYHHEITNGGILEFFMGK